MESTEKICWDFETKYVYAPLILIYFYFQVIQFLVGNFVTPVAKDLMYDGFHTKLFWLQKLTKVLLPLPLDHR